MRIAICDYSVTKTNPVGSCHLRILAALYLNHEFTVFSVDFENPSPDRIRWVRVPAIKRPLALLYLSFHILAPIWYLFHRWYHGVRFDLVQMVESNLLLGDISYSHFCHRAFLAKHWRDVAPGGLRGALRWLDHWLHAKLEPLTYRQVKRIIVPSQGLARELGLAYPYAVDKIQVLANPVDIPRMLRPQTFDRAHFRQTLGLAPEDIVLAFVALGQYERKGLPMLLDALQLCGGHRLKLIVVGGRPDLIELYRERVRKMRLEAEVIFAGMQPDASPYLWSADAFTLPSHYEVFPLVVLEAAAAGLPLLVTPLNGVEEFLLDGKNGILMSRSVEGIARCLSSFVELPVQKRVGMGAQAQRDVERFSSHEFSLAWSKVYERA